MVEMGIPKSFRQLFKRDAAMLNRSVCLVQTMFGDKGINGGRQLRNVKTRRLAGRGCSLPRRQLIKSGNGSRAGAGMLIQKSCDGYCSNDTGTSLLT